MKSWSKSLLIYFYPPTFFSLYVAVLSHFLRFIKISPTKQGLHLHLVFQHADEMRRKSMILKVPKQAMLKGAKRRRAGTVEHCDYLTNKNYRPAKRRRTDPLITLGSILDKVWIDFFHRILFVFGVRFE